MRIRVALTRLLTILGVVGLVLGPASVPVGGGSAGMPAMAMSGDVPDCAGDMGGCDDTKSCPFVNVCVAKFTQNQSGSASIEMDLTASLRFVPRNDGEGKGRAVLPLLRPPSA